MSLLTFQFFHVNVIISVFTVANLESVSENQLSKTQYQISK